MSDDSVTLAAAWRERVAAGATPPTVTISHEGDRYRVRVHGATAGTFYVRYKAHAYAEQIARQVEARQGTE